MFSRDDIDAAFGAAPKKLTDITDGLNPRQKLAVETTDGPVLIRAGAGTGKTTVLIRRMANIIQSGKARPEEILAVTFTRKAAGEMRQRLGEMVGDDNARRATVGNFHAICSQILRRHAHLIGLPQRFNVLDDDGQRDVIGDLAMKLGLLSSKKDRNTIMNYLSQISSWKEDGFDVDQIKASKDLARMSSGGPQVDEPDFLHNTSIIFEAYQLELQKHRWCDFADLVLNVVRIFRDHPKVRNLEANCFRYIMVDEFQDTSPVQAQWITFMARDHRNICVVGDTDQSIYEWRNARPEIMTSFPTVWKGCTEITIDTNYRSTQQILDVANAVVQDLRIKDGLDKLLKSPRSGVSPRDLLRSYDSGQEESEDIAAQITDRIDRGETPGEIAILCRSGMIIKGIERGLRSRGIRYVVAGAMKFTDREEVKDAIAWLTLASNPMDYVAFTRISGKPARGLGPQKLGAIRRASQSDGCSIRDAASRLSGEAKKGSANARHYDDLVTLLDTIEMILQNGSSAGDILEDILDESGYYEWRNDNERDPQQEQRMDNIKMIIEEAGQYGTPLEFLEMVSLQAGGDKGWGDDSVVISTVHASKGLEFDTVFTPAMEEGVFPNARSEKSTYGPDEERRLAHVAWTRARKELIVSYSGYRMGAKGRGIPSRFLTEAGLLGHAAPMADRSSTSILTGKRRLRPRTF
jgi:DNA helicase-2/ATP-dependent DNA helicase PcrA